jgi:hypothetical protein
VRPLLAAVCALLVVPFALADGDPASDVLPTADVYFPLATPSGSARTGLASAVAQVYAHGNRLKVAVIATRQDLGSIPSLYGKPDAYASFLGQELLGFYEGPLLVVEPAGFGIYDGGRSTAAESRVLAGLHVDASSADALTESAAAAVEKLDGGHALASPDVKPPFVYAAPATVRPGRTAELGFRVLDDSERASVTITILAGAKRLATLRASGLAAVYTKQQRVAWRVPAGLPRQGVRLCIAAVDPSGNRAPPACVAVKVEG